MHLINIIKKYCKMLLKKNTINSMNFILVKPPKRKFGYIHYEIEINLKK